MKETLVKYLAGLLDADGSLSFDLKAYDKADNGTFFLGLALSLASSDAVDTRGFVDKLPEETGMGVVSRYGKEKQFKSWKVHKRADLERLLPRLIKHMVIKGKHWQWLLDRWREHRGAMLPAEMRGELAAASKQSRLENRGPVKPKNHPTWAWLAGLIDGDGCYACRRNKCGTYKGTQYHQWTMNVGAVAHKNDAHVLEFIQRAHGGLIFGHGQTESLLVWRRNLGPRDASFALRFLPNLAKHSRLKREKIDQIISHHRQRLTTPSVPLARK